MGGPNSNPQAPQAPMNFSGANASPILPPPQNLPPPAAPDIQASVQAPPMNALFGGATGGPKKPADPNSMLNIAKQALLGFNKGFSAQQSPMPGGAPVQQMQINAQQGGQTSAPSTQGNYPQSSMLKRGQFRGQ
jgi:hypothetical protein